MVVLIVDDEPVVAESTAAVFRHAGHSAYSATSAVEALTLAYEVNPDLLISDVVMPGFSGIDLAIELLARIPNCKVLLISGQAQTADLLEGAAERGYHFEIAAKPLWPPDLIRQAEEIVGRDESSDAATASSS